MQSEPKSRLKTEVTTEIKISQNTKRIYGKPNEQLTPKKWPISYLNLTKFYLDTLKVKTIPKLITIQANTEN